MNSDKHSGAFRWKRAGGVALLMLALGAGLLLAQGNSASGLLAYLPFLLILACPLMMLFMMGSMGSMDHRESASQHQDNIVDGAAPGVPDLSGMTRDEQVWTLRNELTRVAWRQESLRQDLERLDNDHVNEIDTDKTAVTS